MRHDLIERCFPVAVIVWRRRQPPSQHIGCRWRRAYAGMSPSHARRLKELEVENARLKKLLAEAELDKAMLKELAEGKW